MKTSAVSTALTMNTKQLVAGVQAASGSLKKLGKTAADIQKSTDKLVFFEKLKAGVAIAKGVAGTLSGVVRSARDFVTVNTDVIRQQITLAEQLGVTQAEFVGLGQAAANAGIEASQLFEPLSKIPVFVQRAVEGQRDALQVFDQLGLSAERLAKLPAFQQFGAFADAISDIRDASKKALILSKIAGESGLRFRQFFAAGSDGFRKLTEESAKLGLGIGEAGVKAVKILDEAIRSAKDAVQGLKNLLIVELAPDLTKALQGFTEKLKVPEFRAKVLSAMKSIGSLAIDLAKRAADYLLTLAETLATTIEKVSSIANRMDPIYPNGISAMLAYGTTPSWVYKNLDRPSAAVNGGGGWGDDGPIESSRSALAGLQADLQGIFTDIKAAAAAAVKPLQPKPAAGDQGQAAVKVQEQNVAAVKELTRATQQNTQQLRGLAVGDDIRTAGGINTLLSVRADNFGTAKVVRVLERIAEKLDKANQNKPAPVNI